MGRRQPAILVDATLVQALLYLVPLRNVFSGYGFLREIDAFGGIADLRVYGTGGKLGFPMGNAVGVLHIVRGYRGATRMTFHEDRALTLAVVA